MKLKERDELSGRWRDVPIPKHVHAIIIINLQVCSKASQCSLSRFIASLQLQL